MSRKSRKSRKNSSSNTFSRLVTGTVAMAVIFSAGLITGQRVLHDQSMPKITLPNAPGPALASRLKASTSDDSTGEDVPKTRQFSFYDQLSKPEVNAPFNTSTARRDQGRAPDKKTEQQPKKPQATAPSQVQPADSVAQVDDKVETKPNSTQPPNEDGHSNVAKSDIVIRKIDRTTSKENNATNDPQPTTRTAPQQAGASPSIEDPSRANTAKAKATSDNNQADVANPPVPSMNNTDILNADTHATQNSNTKAGRYTLQVGVYPSRDVADREATRLKSLGLTPHISPSQVPGQGTFYRVRVGRFESMTESRDFQANLRTNNSIDTFVTPF